MARSANTRSVRAARSVDVAPRTRKGRLLGHAASSMGEMKAPT